MTPEQHATLNALTGYCYKATRNGCVIAHPNNRHSGKPILVIDEDGGCDMPDGSRFYAESVSMEDPDARDGAIGEALAALLQLKKDRETGYYETKWGGKTAVGLTRVILRAMEEAGASFDAKRRAAK